MQRSFRTHLAVLCLLAATPLIAMAHVPALPATPLYDTEAGIPGLVRHVKRDVAMLVDAGFDAVMFCNENDRPYTLKADMVAAAVMARVVTECIPDTIPFGVDYLWDAECALAVAVATEALFMREVVTGAWESDMGLWVPDAAALLRRRRACDADRVAVLDGGRVVAQGTHAQLLATEPLYAEILSRADQGEPRENPDRPDRPDGQDGREGQDSRESREGPASWGMAGPDRTPPGGRP